MGEAFKNQGNINQNSAQVLEKHLHPFFAKLQRYLEANQSRVQKTKEILATRHLQEQQLDRQILEMTKALQSQSTRNEKSEQNSAKVGPWFNSQQPQRHLPSQF